jgi:hypothetical protein
MSVDAAGDQDSVGVNSLIPGGAGGELISDVKRHFDGA